MSQIDTIENATDDNSGNGRIKTKFSNDDSDEEQMKTLVSTALSARLPPIAMDTIDTLKTYGEKAIQHILRIANRHPLPRVRLYALQAIRDLKKQS